MRPVHLPFVAPVLGAALVFLGLGMALAPAAGAQCPPLPLSETRCFNLPYLTTQWVTVFPNEGKVFHYAEGVALSQSVGIADDCLSHTFYDYNFDLLLDPQYRCLIADGSDNIHCERESISLPQWVWPSPGTSADRSDGDRVWLAGELIYDCGHCDGGPNLTGCYTELHPILAIATIRNRADTLAASGRAGYVPATRTDIWINGDAGCANAIQCVDGDANCPDPWPQLNLCDVAGVQPFPINHRWTFAIALPPRPTPTASPVWRFETRPGDRLASIVPQVTFDPAGNGSERDSLHIVIDMTGVTTTGAFARSIVAGWNPGTSSVRVRHFRVSVSGLQVNDDLDSGLAGAGEFYFNLAVNGIWQSVLGNIRTQTPTEMATGARLRLNKVYDFAITEDAAIQIDGLGFDDDAVLGCTILNGDPGQFHDRWTLANNFGLGTHIAGTTGGDATNALQVQYTIAEVTEPFPLTAVAPPAGTAPGSRFALVADHTVVSRQGVGVHVTMAPSNGPVAIRIFDATGSLVRTILAGFTPGDGAEADVRWDGRDALGRPVVAGVYLAVLRAGGADVASTRMVVVR